MCTNVLPVMMARAVARKMANVVVRIPLPVDPGDEPMKLTHIIRKIVAN